MRAIMMMPTGASSDALSMLLGTANLSSQHSKHPNGATAVNGAASSGAAGPGGAQSPLGSPAEVGSPGGLLSPSSGSPAEALVTREVMTVETPGREASAAETRGSH